MNTVYCLLNSKMELLSIHRTIESLRECQRVRKVFGKEEGQESTFVVNDYRSGHFNEAIAEEEARQMQEQGQG